MNAKLQSPGLRACLRKTHESEAAEVLASIYDEQCNLAIWRRQLPGNILRTRTDWLNDVSRLALLQEVSTQQAQIDVQALLAPYHPPQEMVDDIACVVDMYGCLFDTSYVGLRLRMLSSAMCPRFHVDHVTCRLITTLVGGGTQWLPQASLLLSDLTPGAKSAQNPSPFHTLACSDVALLKGSAWPGNENGAIMHRSPPVAPGDKRLVLTLD